MDQETRNYERALIQKALGKIVLPLKYEVQEAIICLEEIDGLEPNIPMALDRLNRMRQILADAFKVAE